MTYLTRLLPLAVAGAVALGAPLAAKADDHRGGYRHEVHGRHDDRHGGRGWGPPPGHWRGPPRGGYYYAPPPRVYVPPPVVYYPPPPPPRYYPAPQPGVGLYFRF